MPIRESNETERANKAANHGEDSQDDERYRHDRRGFVNVGVAHFAAMVRRLLFYIFISIGSPCYPTIITHEDTEEQSEHVKSGEARREQTDGPEDVEPG